MALTKNTTSGKTATIRRTALIEEEAPAPRKARPTQAKPTNDRPPQAAAKPVPQRPSADTDQVPSVKKPAPTASGPSIGKRAIVSLDLRQRMIRDAAYFRAESRGFTGGDPLQDWVEAEAEIDRLLSHAEPSGQAGTQASH